MFACLNYKIMFDIVLWTYISLLLFMCVKVSARAYAYVEYEGLSKILSRDFTQHPYAQVCDSN